MAINNDLPFPFFFASHHIHSTLGFFFFVHQRKNLQTKYEEGIFAQRSWTLHKLAIILTREVGLLLKSAAFQTIILIATILEFWKKPRSSAFFDRVEFLENSDDSLVWWQICVSTFLAPQNSWLQNLWVVIKFFTIHTILCRKRPFLDGYNCTTLVVLSHSTLSDRLNKVVIAYQSNDYHMMKEFLVDNIKNMIFQNTTAQSVRF